METPNSILRTLFTIVSHILHDGLFPRPRPRLQSFNGRPHQRNLTSPLAQVEHYIQCNGFFKLGKLADAAFGMTSNRARHILRLARTRTSQREKPMTRRIMLEQQLNS